MAGLHDFFTSSGPFPHIQIPEIFNQEPLEKVIEALTKQEFIRKDSDLFQMAQTLDFEEIENPVLTEFNTLFKSPEFVGFMSYISNVALSSDVDMLGNIYSDTDYLLCHDDKLSRRKIAYILYLTDLTETDGGSLNLFNTLKGKPNTIVKKMIPKYNTLTFFLVTPISFHEVEEIINSEVFRVTISGWFNND